MKFLHLGRDLVKSDIPRSASGLAVINADRFDAAAAIGGWRGVLESAVPTLVFVIVLAVAPTALVTALVTSLAVSAAALLIRLVQRQSLTQVMGGVLVAVASAAWAWRSGQASDFYATGLVINAVWLAVCYWCAGRSSACSWVCGAPRPPPGARRVPLTGALGAPARI